MASFFDDPETKVDDYWAAQNEAQKGVQITEVSPPVAASGQPVQPTPASNPNIIANRTPAVTQNKQSYQIMEDIYSLPKPEYDATKASEIKRLAKINALSQGFNVLGDVISLGMGANVNKRQPDTLPQQLWQYKQHYDDTYQQRLDQWRTQQAVQRIRGLEYQSEKEWRQDQAKKADEWKRLTFGAEQEYRNKQLESLDESRKQAAKDREEDNIRRAKEFASTMSLNRAQLDWQQKKAIIEQMNEINKPFMQYKNNTLTEGEARDIYEQAKEYYKKNGTWDEQLFFQQYQNSPLEGVKQVVAKYLSDIDKQKEQSQAGNSWVNQLTGKQTIQVPYRPGYNTTAPTVTPMKTQDTGTEVKDADYYLKKYGRN